MAQQRDVAGRTSAARSVVSTQTGRPYLPVHALPPGYRVPVAPDPERGLWKPDPSAGLRLAEKNHVSHSVELDLSPHNWADRVLRVVVGYREQWSPVDYFGVLPQGYELEPGRALAFLPNKKIKFARKWEAATAEAGVLRSISDPAYTLSSDGAHLVLSKGAERRWLFASPDQGATWRLSMIQDIQRPEQVTRLHYQDGVVARVDYPNGARAMIDYENGLPVRVRTPFNQWAAISRNASGHIVRIEIYRGAFSPPGSQLEETTRSPTGPLRPARVYEYGRDEQGRITRYVAADGRAFRVDYREHNSETGTDYTTRIISERDGSFRERVHHATRRVWTITDQYGPVPGVAEATRRNRASSPEPTEQEMDAGVSTNARGERVTQANAARLEVVGGRWAVVSRSRGSQARQTTMQLDDRGSPAVVVGPTGLSRVMEHDQAGNRTRVADSGGRRESAEFNGFGQWVSRVDESGRQQLRTFDEAGRLLVQIGKNGQQTTYAYGPEGYPAASTLGQARYGFAFDEWGRMVELVYPGGFTVTWDYDVFGDMSRISELEPGYLDHEGAASAP